MKCAIHWTSTLLLGALLAGCPPVEEPEPIPVEPVPKNSALTIYNGGRALVKDTRAFTLEQGENVVRFDDVTSGIIPGSVHVEALGESAVAVHEQNFEYDLVSTPRLMQRYLDEEIQVTMEDGSIHSGTLLAGGSDVILEDAVGGITVLRADHIRDYQFPDLPEGLASRPSLLWSLDAAAGGEQDLTVTYLTSGFNWSADYIVQLSEGQEQVDLSGWVSVTNNTEATFDQAHLKLVAGNVNMVSVEELPVAEDEAFYDLADVTTRRSVNKPVERSFFDYHLYELPLPVTARAHETKQVEFADVQGVAAEVQYDLQFGGYWYGNTVTRHPQVSVEIVNGKDSALGIPLPAGIVRVYKADIDGAAELVGESRIEHTPVDETIELNVGEAFDIVGEWKQTKHRIINSRTNDYSYEAVVRNHKTEEVTVTLAHQPYHWGEWKVTKTNGDHTRPDNAHLEFEVTVPPEGETTLTYTIRSRW